MQKYLHGSINIYPENPTKQHNLSRTDAMLQNVNKPKRKEKNSSFAIPKLKTTSKLDLPTNVKVEDESVDYIQMETTSSSSPKIKKGMNGRINGKLLLKSRKENELGFKAVKCEEKYDDIRTRKSAFETESYKEVVKSHARSDTYNTTDEISPHRTDIDTSNITKSQNKIRPASFVLKVTSVSTGTQTDIISESGPTLVVGDENTSKKVQQFKVDLGHDQFTTRIDKPVFDSKGNDIHDLICSINDRFNLKCSGGGGNSFITLDSRFKVLHTMDMQHLELLPEGDSVTDSDPIRIFNTLSREFYKPFLKESCWRIVPELIVTRLYS